MHCPVLLRCSTCGGGQHTSGDHFSDCSHCGSWDHNQASCPKRASGALGARWRQLVVCKATGRIITHRPNTLVVQKAACCAGRPSEASSKVPWNNERPKSKEYFEVANLQPSSGVTTISREYPRGSQDDVIRQRGRQTPSYRTRSRSPSRYGRLTPPYNLRIRSPSQRVRLGPLEHSDPNNLPRAQQYGPGSNHRPSDYYRPQPNMHYRHRSSPRYHEDSLCDYDQEQKAVEEYDKALDRVHQAKMARRREEMALELEHKRALLRFETETASINETMSSRYSIPQEESRVNGRVSYPAFPFNAMAGHTSSFGIMPLGFPKPFPNQTFARGTGFHNL